MVSDDEKLAFSRLESQLIQEQLNLVKLIFEEKKNAIGFLPSSEQIEIIQSLLKATSQFLIDVEAMISFKDKILTRLKAARFDDKNAKAICVQLFWKRFDIQGKRVVNEARKDQEQKETKLIIPENLGGIAFVGFLRGALKSAKDILAKMQGEKAAELSKLKKESEYVNIFLARFCISNFTIDTSDDGGIIIHYAGVPPKEGIQYSLSEGEKTALSFAYFLSKYHHEVVDNPQAKEEDYTIVIDDPVSSLDENRLFSTALVIHDILIPKVAKKEKDQNDQVVITAWTGCRQIIILSHNIIFLKFMSNIIDSEQCKGRVDLYIEKGVIHSLPNSLRNYQTSYFQKLEKIQAYISGEISHESAKDYLPNYIRVTLEAFISFKIARLKGKDKHLPAMLDSLIGTLTSNDKQFDKFTPVSEITNTLTLKTTLLEIKQKTNPECHGTTQDITHIEYLSDTELKKLAKQMINVIQFLDQIHYEKIMELQKAA
jgi:hypothetical protein